MTEKKPLADGMENLRGQLVDAFIDGKYRRVRVVTHIRGDKWMVYGSCLPQRYRRPDGTRRVVVRSCNFQTVEGA